MITPHPTSHVWRQLIRDILEHGDVVAPASAGSEWRGRTTFELLAHRSVIPMDRPVVLSPGRKLGMRFLAAEAAWIASGDNRVATIASYAPIMKKFSDDGVRFFGAYGPRFIDQLSYVTKCLTGDPASRQAVVEVWREQPRSTNDVPCTLSWQWLIRAGKLHCAATMRSSDVWTGWVYDVFNFSVLSAIVALELRAWVDPKMSVALEDKVGLKDGVRVRPYADLALGNLYFTAGSQHLYKIDEDLARKCAYSEAGSDAINVAPLDLAEFANGDQLIEHLWDLAKGQHTSQIIQRRWLTELYS